MQCQCTQQKLKHCLHATHSIAHVLKPTFLHAAEQKVFNNSKLISQDWPVCINSLITEINLSECSSGLTRAKPHQERPQTANR